MSQLVTSKTPTDTAAKKRAACLRPAYHSTPPAPRMPKIVSWIPDFGSFPKPRFLIPEGEGQVGH